MQQEFNGLIFHQFKDTGYFRCFKNKKVILMHRYVWEYYNGPIPEDYDVHHIDGDPANNDISNLELREKHEHRRFHARDITDEQREWKRQHMLNTVIPKATEWHKSEAGHEWHKQQIRKQHENGVFKRELICTQCGKTFIGEKNGEHSFCSGACKSKYRRDNHLDDEIRVCAVCDKEFSTNKYKKAICCSRSCSNRYRSQHRNNIETKDIKDFNFSLF